MTLTHRHLLPEPSVVWRIAMELDRGAFREIVPEVEALGDAVVVAAGDGAPAAAFGLRGELRRGEARRGEVLLPSLAPGRYRVELYRGDGDGEPVRVRSDVEVRAGDTRRLDAGGR